MNSDSLRLVAVSAMSIGAVFVTWTGFVLPSVAKRRTNRRARRWGEVGRAAERFCEGATNSTRVLSDLLRSRRTRTLTVRALADRIRVDPELGRRFRGRDQDLVHLRSWVAAQLSGRDEAAHREAAEIVATLRMRSCADLLLVTLDRAKEDRTRETICRALVVIDPNAAVGTLLRLLEQSGHTWTSDLLAVAATRTGTRSIAQLALQARVSTWSQSGQLLRATRMAGAESLPILTISLSSADPQSRADALHALASMERLRLTEAVNLPVATSVIDQLDHAEARVRLGALRVLERHWGDPDAWLTSRSTALLSDENRPVRFAAAALLTIVDPAGDALVIAACSADPLVRETAEVTRALVGPRTAALT